MNSIKAFKKILLIRPEMIGDTILLTSIISTIKRFFPPSQVHMLLRPGMEEIIKNNEEVSGYILTKKDLNFLEFWDLVNQLKKEKFDVSIVFEDNPTPQFALTAYFAGIPNRIGDKARVIYGWTYNRGIWVNSADLTKHHIELYLKLLEPLGIKDCKMPLKINLDPEAENKIGQILPKKEPGEYFIGIHIGTGGGNRALLPETYAQISDLIQNETKCRVFLLGGDREKETLHQMKKIVKKPYVDLVGKLSLQELFSVVKRMDLFIGVDSGPLHAAAAFSIPTVAIYTAKDVNPKRWLPWMTKNAVIISPPQCPLKCSHRKCNYDYCLKVIDPNRVVKAGLELLWAK